MENQISERGNALFYILIAVALFGSLTYAVSSSMQGGSSKKLTDERARVLATELMNYGPQLSNAMSRLRLNGCSFEEINFDQTTVGGYDNSSAPGDESCDVFENAGGNATWPSFPPDAFDSQWSSETDYGQPVFTIKNQVPEIGSDGSSANNYDLLMLVEGITKTVCETINNRLHEDTTIPSVSDDIETKFDGTINTTGTFTFPAALAGWRSGCYQNGAGDDSGNYTYFYVISAR